MNRQKGAIVVIGIILASGLLTFLILGELQTPVVTPLEGFDSTWSYAAGDAIRSAPALYDVDGDGLLETVFGSDDTGIHALNGEDGSVLWTYPTMGDVSSSPAIADIDNDNLAEVIVGSEDGNLYVLNGEDGSRLWSPPQDDYYWTGSLAYEGEIHQYSINIGESALEMHLILECGSNDYDLYVGHEYEPTTSDYDYRGYTGTGEDFTINNPEPGTWNIMVHSYSGSGSYDLWVTVDYEAEVQEDILIFGDSLAAQDDEEVHSIGVPEGTVTMRLLLECGGMDFDLYGGFGYIPSTSSYDFRGYSSTGEDLTIDSPSAGTWYLMVHAYSGSGAYTLTITLSHTVDQVLTLSGMIETSPVAVDLENDGSIEVIIGTTAGAVYVLNGLTGVAKWTYFDSYKIQCTPVIADVNKDGILDVIVGTANGDIIALSGETGLPIWEIWISGYTPQGIISADVDGDSYPDVIVGVESCRILAIDGRDGSILWTTQNYSGILIGFALQNTIPGEYDIIFGSDNGGIHAIQSRDGAHLWSKDLESPISTAPTIADVTGDGDLEIIVGTESGSVIALGNNRGAVIWNVTFPSTIDTALAIGDLGENITLDLVVGCEDGTIYSIQLENSGRRIFWQGVGGANDFTRVGSMQLLDADRDMLSRYSEGVYATSIHNNDTDQDQILDGQDVALGLSPILSDSDFDGLGDWEETYIYMTSGSNPDTDFDLLMDSLEINVYYTDPRNNDSDFDSLLDGLEVLFYGSSPLETDSDHDSLPDGMEVLYYGSSPTRNDTDFDLISDYDEVIIYNTNPNSTDSDQDQLSDYLEIFTYLSDPNSPDSDYDGALDGVEIYELGTEVNIADTDLDSYPDGWEAAYGFDPLSAIVPFHEPILYIGPYLLAVVVVAVVGYGAFRWKRSPRPEEEIDTSQEPDSIPSTPDTGPQRKDVQYDLMDGVKKPWLYDGRESLMGEGGAHDFMQWLVKEESHAQDLVNQGKRHEALERLEMLVKYANQEKDLLTKIGPRTFLRTIERLENKIHSIRSTMNKPIE